MGGRAKRVRVGVVSATPPRRISSWSSILCLFDRVLPTVRMVPVARRTTKTAAAAVVEVRSPRSSRGYRLLYSGASYSIRALLEAQGRALAGADNTKGKRQKQKEGCVRPKALF
jgi:hypothetical protein